MSAPDPFALGGYSTDPVLILEAERQRVMQRAFRVRDAADAIMQTMPAEQRRMPKVQIGKLLCGGTEPQPIYAYSEEEIQAAFDRHRNAYCAFWGAQHASVTRLDADEQRLLAEFRAQVAARRAAHDACGYGPLDREADELTNQWCAIEDQLMLTAAASADGVIIQLGIFGQDVKDNETSPERIDARLAVLAAGIRAVAGGAA